MENTEERKFVVKKFFKDYLDLNRSKEDERETVESIRGGVEFKGTNLWILIFATFIASLGLNVNSTAVIIGAMLISPLMGPIMGIGLSVGLNDFELMKRSLKSFLITTLFSVTTATIYFSFTPLDEVQSELLARTSPSIYDVFIALVGGLAGIVALATKEKGNVIPGVAIATALMPPLCTAGFGLATGNLLYFLGAFYLYFINSVFISLATYIGVRLMHFQRKQFVDKAREKLVKRYIVWIAIATMCPAAYLTYGIVRETFYQSAANNFISSELQFPDSQILSRDISYDKREIKVVLLGKEISEDQLQTARSKMETYKLGNSHLTVYQGGGNGLSTDIGNLKSMVMEDFYKNSEDQLRKQRILTDSLQRALDGYARLFSMPSGMDKEMKVLFPEVKSVAYTRGLRIAVDNSRTDTLTMAVVETEKQLSSQERQKIETWLKARFANKNLQLLIK